MGAVSLRDLRIEIGSIRIIDDLSLEIAEGEFIVLLGPSGCGKSTLLNAIAGLVDIAQGQVWIAGRNVTWSDPKDRGIGMVFQSYSLYPRMTVAENLSFGLRIAKVPKNDIVRRVANVSKLMQLDPLLKRKPSELSGGQRQRVAIGRALVRSADVFLFDEPLSNLDAKLRNELRVEIKKLQLDLGNTMIYVTHDQMEALTLADRIAIMNAGVIQQFATPHTIYHRPANLFVAGFIGSPAMNMVAGKLVRREPGWAFVHARRHDRSHPLSPVWSAFGAGGRTRDPSGAYQRRAGSAGPTARKRQGHDRRAYGGGDDPLDGTRRSAGLDQGRRRQYGQSGRHRAVQLRRRARVPFRRRLGRAAVRDRSIDLPAGQPLHGAPA